MKDEDILKMDFYDFCGVASAWMTDEDKIKWWKELESKMPLPKPPEQ